jgi:hypothetical protein
MSRGAQVELLLSGLVDSSGEPLAGGKVHTYEAGTSTPKAVYTDASLTVAETNPVVLDSLGRALVFGAGTYRFVVTDADNVIVATYDGLTFGNDSAYYYAGTAAGTADDILLTLPIGQYVEGLRVVFVADATNTGATTLNISGLGEKAIKLVNGNDLAAGDIDEGQVTDVLYNGTNFVLVESAFALVAPDTLSLDGGTMRGVIAMGSNKITGLANGTAATDAAAFGQIPAVDGTTIENNAGTLRVKSGGITVTQFAANALDSRVAKTGDSMSGNLVFGNGAFCSPIINSVDLISSSSPINNPFFIRRNLTIFVTGAESSYIRLEGARNVVNTIITIINGCGDFIRIKDWNTSISTFSPSNAVIVTGAQDPTDYLVLYPGNVITLIAVDINGAGSIHWRQIGGSHGLNEYQL